MIERVRGVVTATGADGRGVLVPDHNPLRIQYHSTSTIEVWHTDAPFSDPLAGTVPSELQVAPQPGGTLFRLFETPPGTGGRMHQTATLDYIVVIAGEFVLVLDGGEEVVLHPGDYVVQQGAAHTWRCQGTETCLAAGVMIATQPETGE